MKKKILVIDDEVSTREFFKVFFRKLSGKEKQTYEVVCSDSEQEEVWKRFKTKSYDLMIADLNAQSGDDFELLKQLQCESKDMSILLLLSMDERIQVVEKAIEQGIADDHITKPLNIEVLEQKVLMLLKNPGSKQKTKHSALLNQVIEKPIGQSSSMKNILSNCRKLSQSLSTVLITGESGTGKEVLAKYIHQLSPRRDKQFVEVNCGAIPKELLDSELFGHIKGAFTGAYLDRKGFFEQAIGGTLFLDEIGELPLSLQPRLLRALQEKKIRPVGSGIQKDVDIRLIVATNQNLEHMVQKKTFREDLFFRLHVIHITVPPLRERKEDIPLLVNHFIKKYVSNKDKDYLSSQVMDSLQNYDYPGNVRELENIIERMVVLEEKDQVLFSKKEKEKNKWTFKGPTLSDTGLDLEKFVEEMEKDLILQALEKTGGERKSAAHLLKLSPRSFRYRLQKYKLAS